MYSSTFVETSKLSRIMQKVMATLYVQIYLQADKDA
jgi:hypothetical protein